MAKSISTGKDPGGGDPLRLVKPFGVALDRAGRIFVADISSRAVVVFNEMEGTATRWSGNAKFPLSGPVGVALDAEGRLFVTDTYLAQVVVIDPTGSPVAAFGKGELRRPEGIAVDARAGRVYVGDMRLQQVLSFDLHTFVCKGAIGGPARENRLDPGFFDSPANLAVDRKGQIYVSDTWRCRVQVFSPDGVYLRTIPVQCAGAGRRGRPNALTVDTRGRLYVAESDDGGLQIFDAQGKPFQFIPGPGGGPAAKQSVRRTAILVDSKNRILVVEQEGEEGRVRIYQQPQDGGRRPAQSAGVKRNR